MPVYFAYGANLDRNAMARRCPGSTVLSLGRLVNHRFYVTVDGFASVRREEGATVHGLLWRLSVGDVAALDRFEEVGSGLYSKQMLPVFKNVGASSALVYIGRSSEIGVPKRGYMESVIDHAERCGLPDRYRRELQGWLRRPAVDTRRMTVWSRVATPTGP